MTWVIPSDTVDHLVPGDRGIVVWSLQKLMGGLTLDGIYGDATERKVRMLQATKGLVQDGKAGPNTQRVLLTALVTVNRGQTPDGLVLGVASGESGLLLGAINKMVAGGIDCGAFQRRVYAADYDDDLVIEHAFDSKLQCQTAASAIATLETSFALKPGVHDGFGGMGATEKAWRCAALNHNWPAGAATLAATPIRSLSPSWKVPQAWVTGHGYRFPDGSSVNTPLDWAHMYAGVLGAGVHSTNGIVTKLVTNWL